MRNEELRNADCGLRNGIEPERKAESETHADCGMRNAENAPIPHSAFGMPHSPLRLGVVAYLNMQPLIYGLEEALGPELEMCEGPPSALARRLEEGRIDAGMVPVASLLAHPDWRVAGRGMIGARGAVASVLLAGGGPPREWRILHPDSHSMTSNALARVLLKGEWGIEPELGEPVGLAQTAPPEPKPGEAWVMIGSHALAWRKTLRQRPDCHVIDLGEWWRCWTGLPFIFAVWAARPGAPAGDWPARLDAHLERNQERLEQIAREWPALAADRLTPAEAVEYFTQSVHYWRDEPARRGLERFYDEGRKMGIFREGWRWREWGD